MGSIDLRAYVFLDSLQAQYAAFLGTVAQGFLPLAGDASLSIEMSPGIEINRITDIALKSTNVTAGMQIIERYVRHAGGPFAVPGGGARRRCGHPRRARPHRGRSHQAARPLLADHPAHRRPPGPAHQPHAPRPDAHPRPDALSSWSWSRQPTPRWPPTRPRRPLEINILEVRAFGSFGRIYLGGEERDIDVGWRAALAAIEGLEGREAKV